MLEYATKSIPASVVKAADSIPCFRSSFGRFRPYKKADLEEKKGATPSSCPFEVPPSTRNGTQDKKPRPYQSYIGERPRMGLIEYGPMLSLMECKKKQRPAEYRRFVEGGIAKDDEEFLVDLVRSTRSIGNDKFREWVDDCYSALLADRTEKEDISFRCVSRTLGPEKILKAVAKAGGVAEKELLIRRRDSTLRAVASRMLCKHGGLTQREAARALVMKTGVPVSCQLQKLAETMASDRRTRKLVDGLDRKLGATKR